MTDVNVSEAQALVRYRGEEMWICDEHIANLRLHAGSRMPFVIRDLDGSIRFEAVDRRRAELWARVHATELRHSEVHGFEANK